MQKAWPLAQSLLDQNGLSCRLNLARRLLLVSTTSRTKDPDIIHKAEEFLDLLVNTSIPPTTAIQILDGRLQHEGINTWIEEGGLYRTYEINKCMQEIRLNRRQHLMRKAKEHAIFPAWSRRKKQELSKNWRRLIGKVQSNRAVAEGTSAGVKLFRSIVEGCFLRNEDPTIVVKRLKMDHMVTNLMKKIQALCL